MKGSMSEIKPQDKSSVKKTQRCSSKKKKKEDDMPDVNRTPYQNQNPFKKHSDVPANIISVGSPGFADQNEADSKINDNSDQKAKTENNKRKFVGVSKSKTMHLKDNMLIPLSPDSYEDLMSYPGYIDKTKLILDFFNEFQNCTCILSPRRSGKTTAIQMLKSFCQVPRIDVDTYDPDTNAYASSENTFQRIFYTDLEKRAKFSEKDSDFIEDNMGKWPVIHLDFQDMSFSTKPRGVKFEDVKPKFIKEIIKPAFKEYDYLFFIYLARNICFKLYQTFTTENYKRLFRYYNLKDYEDVQGKIDCLLENFREKLFGEIEIFYKYYTGQIVGQEELIDALKFLMEVLYTFYKRKVIVLVDEHDTPVTSIHSAMSLNNYDENEELMESIKQFSIVM
jgi:hypothetical protein